MRKDKLPFPNAPITEAVLEIRVERDKKIDSNILLDFYSHIKVQFPNKQERRQWESKVEFKIGEPPQLSASSGNIEGYLLKTNDGKKIVQARPNGFCFNKLKPYDNWESFSSEAKSLWEEYKKIVKPNKVIRLGLRYINSIDIPLPLRKFQDYFLTFPDIAKGIPQGISNYFMRLEIPNTAISAHSVVIQAFKPIKEDAKVLPLIFDIDVFRHIPLDIDDQKIWSIMEELRHFKNNIFLNSLTSKAKGLFK